MNHLDAINGALAEEDDRHTAEFDIPRRPVCFVVGLPRSGKTLFHQAAATRLEVGYVSNLLGKFWRAPYLGALLEREVLGDDFVSNFRSHYGNTEGAAEPNEWGWFWNHWLALDGESHRVTQAFDSAALGRKLAALEAVKEKPLFFNSDYANASIAELTAFLPHVLLVHIKRDPYWVASSIINARVHRHGTVKAFYGYRPQNVDALRQLEDSVEEIVLQVRSIHEEMAAIEVQFDKSRVFETAYEDFCDRPEDEIERFGDFLSGHGQSIRRKPTALPERFPSRNDLALLDGIYADRLDYFHARHFAGLQAAAHA